MRKGNNAFSKFLIFCSLKEHAKNVPRIFRLASIVFSVIFLQHDFFATVFKKLPSVSTNGILKIPFVSFYPFINFAANSVPLSDKFKMSIAISAAIGVPEVEC